MEFQEIDELETKKKAKKLLKSFRRIQRIAGADYRPKLTASYTYEIKPQGGRPTGATETMVVRKVSAEQEMAKILEAINEITDPLAREIVIRKYCEPVQYQDKVLFFEVGCSESEYYRRWGSGLIEFAEVYNHGELLTFKAG